jgi:hypothetical protein
MLETFPAPVPAAHQMLCFELDPEKSAILLPQNDDPQPQITRLPDLNFSAEALGQPGYQYDLVKGEEGDFGLVERMESLVDRYGHVESYDPPHPVDLWRLNVSDEVKQAMLAEALKTSEETGLNATYDTFLRSCVTEACGIIDRTTGGGGFLESLAGNMGTERVPNLVPTYLRMRRLIRPDDKPVSLHDKMQAAQQPT